MRYGENQRLRDLDDKQSRQIITIVMDKLESQQGSTTLRALSNDLEIPPFLLEDVIEVLIIKEWLILPDDEVSA